MLLWCSLQHRVVSLYSLTNTRGIRLTRETTHIAGQYQPSVLWHRLEYAVIDPGSKFISECTQSNIKTISIQIDGWLSKLHRASSLDAKTQQSIGKHLLRSRNLNKQESLRFLYQLTYSEKPGYYRLRIQTDSSKSDWIESSCLRHYYITKV